MTNNMLLGKLLSEHKLSDYRRTGLIGCGLILLLPFACGLWSLIASLSYAGNTSDATEGFYVSLAIVSGSIILFGVLALVFFLAPNWQKRAGLEIYESGFVIKRILLNPQICLWSEIREVTPMLLVYDKSLLNTPPSKFGSVGADTKYKGVYEVYKNDGSKINVSRRYTDIERLDEQLIPFCKEMPKW